MYLCISGSMLAHKFKITNPQDYGLFTLENGEGNFISTLNIWTAHSKQQFF